MSLAEVPKQQGISDVAETLTNARNRGSGCALLIGAGCSVTAGIPAAPGIVAEALVRHPQACSHVRRQDYPHMMAALSYDERRSIIGKYVAEARINWAHVCIAQLVKSGYVDRILTVNFDPLVLRACALIGLTPAVYDLAGLRVFDSERIASPALLHLHGQSTGSVMLHTYNEVKKHSRRVKPAISEAGTTRSWLVVGYSGNNDPVFDNLVDLGEFNSRLYWVTHDEEQPPRHVRERLLEVREFGFWVGGFDADTFFVTLLQELGCFPPALIGRPFTHLREQIESLAPYKPTEEDSPDLTATALRMIKSAIEVYENSPDASRVREAEESLSAGRLDDLEELAADPTVPAGVTMAASWGHVLEGNRFLAEARTEASEKADALFEAAYEKYKQALAIRPDMPEALNNWGSALSQQAERKTGKEADDRFEAAYGRFEQALAIKPDNDGVLDNWGSALSLQAMTKTGNEADKLFEAAYEKYEQAVAIKPARHEAFYNWGLALYRQATTKASREADDLLKASSERYEQAVAIKPDNEGALSNWGSALSQRAEMKTGAEADDLFEAAYEKCEQALAIKPDMHEALYNWARALFLQAKMKTGQEADTLFKAAYERFEQALALKPDKQEALNNWGSALSQQAKMKTGREADRLFKAAYQKYEQAAVIKPDDDKALNNWGAALSDQAKMKTGKEADGLFEAAYGRFEQALAITPNMPEALANWGNTLFRQASTRTGKEADGLLKAACEKNMQALAIKPDMHGALCNWGRTLSERATMTAGREADTLYKAACEKFEQALDIEPDMHEALNNWGIALSRQAEMKTGKLADALFRAACEKYEQALAIKPDMHEALANWGISLMGQAAMSKGGRRRHLLALAREKFLAAETLMKGAAAYNLGCLCAIENDVEGCRNWLRNAKETRGLPARARMLEDPDLLTVHNEAWFLDLLV